jgi:hypothetical protein
MQQPPVVEAGCPSDAFIHSALSVRTVNTSGWVGAPTEAKPGIKIFMEKCRALEQAVIVGDVVDVNSPGYTGLGVVVDISKDEHFSVIIHVKGRMTWLKGGEREVWDQFWIVVPWSDSAAGVSILDYTPRSMPRRLIIRVTNWYHDQGVNVRWLSI